MRVRAFAGLLLMAVACSDSPVTPKFTIDQETVERLLPAIQDARLRLAPGIANETVRARVAHDLEQVAGAMYIRDGAKVRFHVRMTANILEEYVTGRTLTDGPDVAAIMLTLYYVGNAVNTDLRLGPLMAGSPGG